MSLSLPLPLDPYAASPGCEQPFVGREGARVRIAVRAAASISVPGYGRLLRALEELYPVHFVREAAGCDAAADAVLCLGASTEARAASGPVFQLAAGEAVCLPAGEMRFANHPALPEAVRGLALPDPSCRLARRLHPGADEEVLADCDGHPVWLGSRWTPLHFVSALPLPQLGEHEGLYAYFRPMAWAALLPLLHWLRSISQTGWQLPAPRAAIVIDDPNLRHRSYGELNYAQLAAAAEQENFHAAIATIPLDAARGGIAAAEVFRQSRGRLSLLVHGNNHTRNELAQRAAAECRRIAAQARERMARLEQEGGLKVDRVMAAPHGACSGAMASALAEQGFAAALISVGSLLRWNPELAGEATLGMLPAWMWNGLPVMHRHGLRHVRVQAVLSRFLGQAAIFTAHHQDCGRGLERLREIAWACNSVAPVQWMSTAALARSNFLARQQGTRLEVRMFAQRASVPLTSLPTQAAVFLPGGESVYCQTGRPGLYLLGAGKVLAAAVTKASFELEMITPPVPPVAPAVAWAAPWARLRRGLCELRDRVAPLLTAAHPGHLH